MVYWTVRNYFEVLKPRETSLLTFIGLIAALIAGRGNVPLGWLSLISVTIWLGSAGVNGLTNYLDRDLDARMSRTQNRVLPSKRIYPPERVLPLTAGLVLVGLLLAARLNLYSFLVGLVGTLVAVTWRKKVTCVFPQGAIASCAPVLIGWFAVKPALSWELLVLCVLIATWLPLHVWSIMAAHRDDYLKAGLNYFPVNQEQKKIVRVLLGFSLVLYASSIALYFVGNFHWLYLALASLLGLVLIYTTLRLALSQAAQDAWRLYKISSFPYLGLIFLIMCLDILLFG